MKQIQLETIVPKIKGANVLVVAGQFKGQGAILLDRRLDKGESPTIFPLFVIFYFPLCYWCEYTGVAALQMKDNMELTRVKLDEVAEYVGV